MFPRSALMPNDSLAQQTLCLTAASFSSPSILVLAATINNKEMQTGCIKKAPFLITFSFLQAVAAHLP